MFDIVRFRVGPNDLVREDFPDPADPWRYRDSGREGVKCALLKVCVGGE